VIGLPWTYGNRIKRKRTKYWSQKSKLFETSYSCTLNTKAPNKKILQRKFVSKFSISFPPPPPWAEEILSSPIEVTLSEAQHSSVLIIYQLEIFACLRNPSPRGERVRGRIIKFQSIHESNFPIYLTGRNRNSDNTDANIPYEAEGTGSPITTTLGNKTQYMRYIYIQR
jgi:hypothetical protein